MMGTALDITIGAQVATATRRRNDDVVSASTVARIAAGTAKATARAYARQWGEFAAWCESAERTDLPATAETIAEYVGHLCGRGLAPASVDQALSVVRSAHKTAGYAGAPDTTAARKVLRGYSRQWAEGGHRVKQAPPAALDQLRAMVGASDPTIALGCRDRALLVLGFALMARRSELAALDIADVREVPEGLVVRIRKSKTDQDAAGVDVAIPYGSRPDTCPVRAVRAWREKLADEGVTTGRLFRPVNRHGRLAGEAITGKGVGLAIRAAAGRAGLPDAEAYSGHSLRAGAATAAARAGVPTGTIARHGRWSPTSPVVHTYVRQVDQWRDNAMAGIGL